jgi:uncharacterized protein YndB with AHSA1/START domain
MPDIFHTFPINSAIEKVFEAISTPEGLDKWWTEKSSGNVGMGETFLLHFGPEYNWTALISRLKTWSEFEITMISADEDWTGSKVGFMLKANNNATEVQFYHTGWKTDNAHYRISNYCWAMYLRILKRNLELGEFVPYADRLSV